MDYEQHVREMLTHHAGKFGNREDGIKLLMALGWGVSVVFAGSTQNHQHMHEDLERFLLAVKDESCELHTKAHGKQDEAKQAPETKEVSAEEFLRDHFKPRKFHG